jgi:hypothetical protein
VFDNCSASYVYAFFHTWENCALDQQSIDNILVSLDTSGMVSILLSLNGGTSSPPGAAGLAAIASLQSKGWGITTN